MNLTQFKKHISGALLDTNYLDPNERIKVYKAALKAVKRFDVDSDRVTSELLKAVFEIENTIVEKANLNVSVILVDSDAVKFDIVEHGILSSATTTREVNAPIVEPNKRKIKFRLPGIHSFSILISASLIAFIAYVFYFNFNDNNSVDQKLANKKLPGKALFQADFFGDLSEFDEETQNLKSRIKLLKDEQGASIKGKAVFTGKDHIPVDVNASYIMKISFKYTETIDQNDTGLFVGFMTFDHEKKLETLAPGTHRYFVAVNKINLNSESQSDDWIELFGVISGTRNTHKSFRPTTKYVKPFILVNNKQPEQTILLRSIELTKI